MSPRRPPLPLLRHMKTPSLGATPSVYPTLFLGASHGQQQESFSFVSATFLGLGLPCCVHFKVSLLVMKKYLLLAPLVPSGRSGSAATCSEPLRAPGHSGRALAECPPAPWPAEVSPPRGLCSHGRPGYGCCLRLGFTGKDPTHFIHSFIHWLTRPGLLCAWSCLHHGLLAWGTGRVGGCSPPPRPRIPPFLAGMLTACLGRTTGVCEGCGARAKEADALSQPAPRGGRGTTPRGTFPSPWAVVFSQPTEQ